MKRSIGRQMMVIFISVLIFMFGAIFACNVWLLESYYIKDKQKSIENMYDSLALAEEQDQLHMDDAACYDGLRRQAERDNLFFLAINMETRDIYTNVRHSEQLQRYLDAFLLNQTESTEEILEETEQYTISRTDGFDHSEYLMMRGTLPGGHFFLIQCPLESIRDSISLTNRFLLIVGGIVVAICMVLVWFFSRRLTEPLRELADLSEKMTNLDFEAKYTSGGENEIGVLGQNFNHMSEKLEASITDLKNANYKLRQDIERKEKLEQMRSEFLGNVSHELKTPIALIQGYAEGLKEGVNDDVEGRDFYCDVIMDEADKMNRMVKNLLTLNQLEFGDDEMEFERFDLTALVSGVIQSMELFAEQTNANVRFVTKDPVYVWADEYKTEQVIRNYLSNAFHHVSGENVIEIKIETDGEVARTTVFNTGKPIPEEDLGHIWEKFYKVDKAHTREYGGNGIGLSIVKAIMESFRQDFGVHNYDNGVAFWFELGLK